MAVAFANYQQRFDRYREQEEYRLRWQTAAIGYAAMSGRRVQPPRLGPEIPPPHIASADALSALYGWRSGRQDRDWWARRRHETSDTMQVADRYGRRRQDDAGLVATISRAEYERAHASTARTLARLVERDLLEPHPRWGWYLTEAGVRWCAAWLEHADAA
jgi:hypothetical protein